MTEGPHRPTTGNHRALRRRRRATRSLVIGVSVAVLAFAPEAVAWQDAEETAATEPAEEHAIGVEVAPSDPRVEPGPPIDENWFLFGRWNDWRAELASQGITFDINWTQSFQGVVDGGRNTGFSYGGSLDYAIDLSLDKMGVLPGAFVSLLAESRYGESANADAGTIMPVNTDLMFPLTDPPDDNIALTVTQLTYTQFLSEKFGVFLGKMQTLDGDANEFASGRGRSQFMNGGFIFNPVTMLSVPYSTLGVGVVWMPTDKIMITGLVVNTSDSSTTTGFGDFGEGWTSTVEGQFQYKLGGLPGGQVATIIYAADGEFVNFSRSDLLSGEPLLGTEDDTWALTWSAWQYLYTPDEVPDRIDTTDGRPDVRGVGLFMRLGVADDDTNPIDLSISGGVGGRGLIPGRDDDTYGLGIGYADFDTGPVLRAAGFDDNAWAIEAFYNADIGRGLALTVDLQVLDPFNATIGTTTLVGARLNVRF